MDDNQTIRVVYDGDCVYCENFVQMSNLRHNLGEVKLINARSSLPPEVTKVLTSLDIKLDDGMLVLVGDKVFYGPDAITFLSFYADKRSLFRRIFFQIFKSSYLNKFLYPVMKLGRSVTLFLRGIGKLGY